MKWTKLGLRIAGFCLQFLVPIILFGTVVPYTKENAKTTVTTAGFVALAILFIIMAHKFKEKILTFPKSALRGVALSLIPILIWTLINIGVDSLQILINNICIFWDKVLIFVILGRLCYVIEETLEECDRKEKEKPKTESENE